MARNSISTIPSQYGTFTIENNPTFDAANDIGKITITGPNAFSVVLEYYYKEAQTVVSDGGTYGYAYVIPARDAEQAAAYASAVNIVNAKIKDLTDEKTYQNQVQIEADIDIIRQNSTTIAAKQTIIADKQTVIADETITIDNHLDRLQSTVDDLNVPCGSSGPHARVAGTSSCIDDYWLTRALAIYNMRTTGIIDEIRKEIRNPTRFP